MLLTQFKLIHINLHTLLEVASFKVRPMSSFQNLEHLLHVTWFTNNLSVRAKILINSDTYYMYGKLANPTLHQGSVVINVINYLALLFLIAKLRRLNFAFLAVHKKGKYVSAKRHLAIRIDISELRFSRRRI